jgi:hypothetical protein
VTVAVARLLAPLKAARCSPVERQAAIRDADAATASKVWQHAIEVRDMDAARLAIKLSCSVAPENQFVAEGFERDGETYATAGQFVVPSTRISVACLKKQGARHRRVMRAMFENYKLLVGLSLRFYTVTMPDFGASFEVTLLVLEDALRSLKRTRMWRDAVRGAYDKIEWTGGKREHVHHHTHAHLLVAAKWIPAAEFAAVWTRCVRRAAAKHGVAWTLPKRGVLSVKLKTKTLPEMINEMSKYLAKPSDYERLTGAELVEISRVLKGRRLFNSYGDFNANSGSVENIQNPKQMEDERLMPNVHTGSQLNSSTSLATPQNESESSSLEATQHDSCENSPDSKEVWNVTVLDEWRRAYLLRFREQRERRLEWLQAQHPRCKITTGTGATHYGSSRLRLAEAA